MSRKPQFPASLLIGSLTIAISFAAIFEFSRNRAGPFENKSISSPASSLRADVPAGAVDFNPAKNIRAKAADQGGKTSFSRAPLDARPANLLRFARSDRVHGVSAPINASPATFSSPAEDRVPAATPTLMELARIPALASASSASAGSSSGFSPNSVDAGFSQGKGPLFARHPKVEGLSPPPPPVLDARTENRDTGPKGESRLSSLGDGADSGSGAQDETANNPPTADPGNDRAVFVGDSVALDGSGSSDSDGGPLTFWWSFVSRPAESLAFIAEPSAATSFFAADVAGVYIVQLVVGDGNEESLPQLIVVTAELRGLTVPAVVGLSLTEARKILIDAGFEQVRISTVPNPEIPKNQVVQQQPSANSPLYERSTVSLVISFPLHDDDDQDGLPDAWEYAEFGDLAKKGNDDADGDGYTNHQEYTLETDPADGTEAPVPAGNFFEYDAFGRILVKQITLEP